MSEHPHHESLRLQNFTAFADASFEFVPGINVFVGENGTGKTHAMKAIYAWHRSHQTQSPRLFNLESIFQVADVSQLIRDADGVTLASGLYGGEGWSFNPLQGGDMGFDDIGSVELLGQPVFIPAIDMIGHTRGFVQTYDRYKIDFDLTHRDIVDLLLSPALRQQEATALPLVEGLKTVLNGELELDGDRFYLRVGYRRFAMPNVAEGLRKVATLLRLIEADALRPGATLLWDEPEVNLNPKLMDEVVGALLALSRNGVQILLATHSYVILKELDLQSNEGEVRYFAFKPSEEGTTVTWDADFGALEPNAILDQYDKMLIEGMKKADTEAEASGRR